jgi:hypothetical protein
VEGGKKKDHYYFYLHHLELQMHGWSAGEEWTPLSLKVGGFSRFLALEPTITLIELVQPIQATSVFSE